MSGDPTNLVRAFADDVWNEGDFAAGAALFATTFRHHDLVTRHDTDLDGYFDSVRQLRSAFSGVRFQIEDAITDGERVATRWRVSGVHDGSGRAVAVDGMSIDLVEMGTIAENWTVWDRHGLLEQLQGE